MKRRRQQQNHEEAEPRTVRESTLDQDAGAIARGLIKQMGVEDTTANWQAIKRAYLIGYADASR